MSTKLKRNWTQAEKALLAELKAQGIPRAEIAERLGRSPSAVKHLLYDKPAISVPRRETTVTEKEKAWLTKHYKHTANAEIVKKLSISHSTLHRLAREMGLEKSRQFVKKCQLAASKAAFESHKRNGTFPPKGYRIPGSEKASFKPGKGRGVWERVSPAKAARMKAKAQESIRRTRESERRRVLYWGFEPRTKLKLTRQGASKLNYRYGLRKLGYIEDPGDHNLYYYTASTARGTLKEANAKKHGIRIMPLPESGIPSEAI